MNLARVAKNTHTNTKGPVLQKQLKVSFPNETFAEVLSDPLLLRQYIYTHE